MSQQFLLCHEASCTAANISLQTAQRHCINKPCKSARLPGTSTCMVTIRVLSTFANVACGLVPYVLLLPVSSANLFTCCYSIPLAIMRERIVTGDCYSVHTCPSYPVAIVHQYRVASADYGGTQDTATVYAWLCWRLCQQS